MRSLFILSVLFLLVTSCSKTSIHGSGSTVSETRTVASFRGVKAKGDVTVEVKKGTHQKVVVTGYENLVPVFESTVINGMLVLKFREDYYNIRNNNITVTIEAPEFEAASIDGSGSIMIRDYTGNNLSATINGSGNIIANYNKFTNAYYSINGSGVIRASQIDAENVEITVNGSGTVDALCSKSLKAVVHGSGNINYWGNPTSIETEVSGSGIIRKR